MSRMKEKGIFTWRVFLALLLSLALVQPMSIWGGLAIGMGVILSSYIILLFLSEVFRLAGKPLTSKEMLAITAANSAIAVSTVFTNIIWMYFFTKSQWRYVFKIDVPEWWMPPEAIMMVDNGFRSLISPVWLTPILLVFVAVLAPMFMEMSLGRLFFQLRVIEEKLTFPVQSATVEFLRVLGGGGEEYANRVLLFGLMIGVGLGVSEQIGLAPLSAFIYDLRYLVEPRFPGAALAISPISFFTGLILPVRVTAVMLATAILTHFVGNHLLVSYGIWRQIPPSPDLILRGWTGGMSCQEILYYSTLNFWLSIIFGFALAVALIPIFLKPRSLIRIFALKSNGKRIGLELFGIYTLCVLLVTGVVSFLTGYPFPQLFLMMLSISFILSYLNTGLIGVTGYSPPTIPYLTEAFLMLGAGGRPPINIWFATPTTGVGLIELNRGGGWTGIFLQCYRLGVRFRDYVLLHIGTILAGLIVSMIFHSIFWSIAPIPSALYPMTAVWERRVIDTSTWITLYSTRSIFKPNLVMIGLILGSAVTVSGFFFKMPWLPISILSGLTSDYATYASLIPQFFGSLFRTLIMSRVFGSSGSNGGSSQFASERATRAGYLLWSSVTSGASIWLVVRTAIIFASRSLWILPY